MANKKFTILTASYNCGRYLEDWAESILAQIYRPLEVVFVEDKSTDRTLSLLDGISNRFLDAGVDFKLVNPHKKLYCGSAYNLALKNATGEYFGVLDSDDMLEPFACDFIAGLYSKFSDVSWIYTQYNKYNRRMTRIIKRGFCSHPGKRQTILSREGQHINTYGHWRTFSNRIKKFRNLFGKGLRCCVDKHLGFRLEELGVGMFVDKVCYKYRTRSPGEKPIVHFYPLKEVRGRVVREAKRRRKSRYIYRILEYRD